MLNGSIRVKQRGPNYSNPRVGADSQKLLDPVSCDDLGVVVQKKQVFARRQGSSHVTQSGKVERLQALHDAKSPAFPEPTEQAAGLRLRTTIVNEDNLKVAVGGGSQTAQAVS